MNHFGVTLLYYNKKTHEGIKKSYILKKPSDKNVRNTIKFKADEELQRYPAEYSYVGINDLFSVSGEAVPGHVLGRTSYYEFNDIDSGKSLCNCKSDYSATENALGNHYTCSLVFFQEDDEQELSYTLTVLTLINAENLNLAIENLNNLIMNQLFKERIAEISVDDLSADRLLYLGIEDIYNIEDDIKSGGSFLTFYADFESYEDLKEEEISEVELSKIIKELELS